MFDYTKCDTREFFNTTDMISKRFSKLGYSLKKSCYCRSEPSQELKERFERKCTALQNADGPHNPKEGVYVEFVKCLHFENGGKGVILSIEGYVDETEAFAKKIWEDEYRRKSPKEAERVLRMGSIRCFTYGFEGGKPFADFNCSPSKENKGSVKWFTGKKKSWMEKLNLPRSAVVIRKDGLMEP